MDLLVYFFEHAVKFCVASVPLVLVFILLRVFKFTTKTTVIHLLTIFVANIFVWIKLKNVNIIFYQFVPYVSSLLYIWASEIVKMKIGKNEDGMKPENTGDEKKKAEKTEDS